MLLDALLNVLLPQGDSNSINPPTMSLSLVIKLLLAVVIMLWEPFLKVHMASLLLSKLTMGHSDFGPLQNLKL